MSRQLAYGGTERQITEVAKGLDRDAFEPHVGCFVADGVRAAELKSAGIPIVRFNVRSLRNFTAIQGARELARYVRDNGIDIVHTFDVPANMFGVIAARACKCPYVISSQRAQRRLTRRGDRLVLAVTDRLSDRIVVNCNAVRRELIAESHTPADRIRLVYNGVDTRVFNPGDRVRQSVVSDKIAIGVVCALRPEKGLETLLLGFAAIHSEFPRAVLVIVGSGPMEERLYSLAGQLGIMEQCLFVPATPNPAEWLRSIDIFVLPSLSEALSNSIMEAMACGCAVVASDIGGNPELVESGRTGLLFPVGDHEELASQLRLLIGNEELRRRFGAAGTQRMIHEFSTEQSMRAMENVYGELLQTAPRSFAQNSAPESVR